MIPGNTDELLEDIKRRLLDIEAITQVLERLPRRPPELEAVLSEVAVERQRQDTKWGEQNHDPAYWLAILGEEYGEACKAFLDTGSSGPDGVFHPQDLDDYREELIQTAAVAVSAIECLDRSRRAL